MRSHRRHGPQDVASLLTWHRPQAASRQPPIERTDTILLYRRHIDIVDQLHNESVRLSQRRSSHHRHRRQTIPATITLGIYRLPTMAQRQILQRISPLTTRHALRPALRNTVQRRLASGEMPKLTGAADNAFNRERMAVKQHAAASSGI